MDECFWCGLRHESTTNVKWKLLLPNHEGLNLGWKRANKKVNFGWLSVTQPYKNRLVR